MKTDPPAFLCVRVLVILFGFLASAPVFAQSDPFLAQTWDNAINLPPGAYRAAKPIELDGAFYITTAPWSMIDSVTFNGTKGSQHWHLNGTVLQRVNINGQLGVSMVAKDSVFEECNLNKNSGWFVNMWGTNWQFDNCIFSRKFMRDTFPVNDYSVYANHCTFYDIKLPPVGLVNNPGTYLQKKHMGFVSCRFVRCDVPESFLAATVNCVFEDCNFPAKRPQWPAKTTPITVNAMYAGMPDVPPQSFQNGPLSVQFSEAPMKVDAGSTLPHTENADEITLTNYNPPLQYLYFGSVEKRSSEFLPPSPAMQQFLNQPQVGGTTPNL